MFGEPIDYQTILESGGVLIDVRTPNEFSSGHAPISKNIPLPKLSEQVQYLEGKRVVLICRSGVRAAQGKRKLEEYGIKAYNGGAWTNFK